MRLHDWNGTPIEPGDTVAYGSLAGELVVGTVERFTEKRNVIVNVARRSGRRGKRTRARSTASPSLLVVRKANGDPIIF
ncbi:hypothetical protein [Streptomyces sp. NPDC050507]|uniref:hypothetical protein n=1 Tax=Streptomyces sp. NPDC050507 TaxID=3365619 RepID=UPI0037B22EC9